MIDIDYTDLLEKHPRKTRYFIVDEAVNVEGILTFTLGKILDIVPEKSKSLGNGSDSLSFYHKILLIQDKRGIPTEIKRKLETFIHIRNKFAHLRKVESFTDFFALSDSTAKDKKFLDKWYSESNKTISNFEIKYRQCFSKLSSDIIDYLIGITLENQREKSKLMWDLQFNKEFVKKLQTMNLKGPITVEIWNETLDAVLKTLKNNIA
jgi:hypothetical protein